MAWGLRATGTTAYASSGNLTVTPPAGIVTNDLLVLVSCSYDSATHTPDGTWVRRYGSTSASGVLNIWTKSAGPTTGSATITHSGGPAQGVMLAFKDMASPYVGSGPSTMAAGSSATVTFNPLTTTANSELVLMLAMSNNPLATWAAGAAANLSGVSEAYEDRHSTVDTNLVYNPCMLGDSNADGIPNGWNSEDSLATGHNATYELTATNAVFGATCWHISYTGLAGDSGNVLSYMAPASAVGTCVAGTELTASVYLRGTNSGCDVRLGVRYYDAAGQYLNVRTYSTLTINNTSMDRYTHVCAPCTLSNCSRAILFVSVENIAEGDAFDIYIDGAQLEYGTSASTFLQASARINYAKNPSFETNTNYWVSSYDGTSWDSAPQLTRTSATAQVGSYVGRWTGDGSALTNRFGKIRTDNTSSDVGTVSPGETWYASIYLKGTVTASNGNGSTPVLKLSILWIDENGAFVGAKSTTITDLASGSYTRYSVTGAAPNYASMAQLQVGLTNLYGGDNWSIDVDAALLEQSGSLNTYFDGASTNCTWAGTVHNSNSQSAGGGYFWTGTENNSVSVKPSTSLAIYTATMDTAGSVGSPTVTKTGGGLFQGTSISFKAANVPGGNGEQKVPALFSWGGSSWGGRIVKSWSSGAWKSSGLKTWSGTSWITIINKPTTGLPTSYLNAVTDGNCHNDGSTDDTTHLQDIATTALSENKALYLPSGSGYHVTDWVPPTDSTKTLVVFGDGDGSWIKGQTRLRSRQTFKNLRMGAYDTSIGKPYGTTSVTQAVEFHNCLFTHGVVTHDNTDGIQTDPGFWIPNSAAKLVDWLWQDCRFKVANADYDAAGQSQAIYIAMDPEMGGYWQNMEINSCHFGLPNDYGATEQPYGHVEFYELHNNLADSNSDNVYILNNTFEKCWQWSIDHAVGQGHDDFAGVNETQNRIFVHDNLFKGSGGHKTEINNWLASYNAKHEGQYQFPVPYNFPNSITFECASNGSTISRNTFFRTEQCAINLTFRCYEIIVEDNVIDKRVDNGITPTNHGEGSTDYMVFRTIRSMQSTNTIIRRNKLYIPQTLEGVTYSKPADNTTTGWIYQDLTGWGGGNTTSDNQTFLGGAPGVYPDAETD